MQGSAKISLSQCNINHFKFKAKAVISTGPCDVVKEGSQFNFNSKQSFMFALVQSGFVRIREINYCTYLIIRDDSVYSFSLPGDDFQNISKFQNFILKYSKIIDFYSLQPVSQQRNIISSNCPMGPEAEPLGRYNSDNLKNAGKSVGSIFGTVSAIFQFDEFNKDARDSINRFEQNNLGNNPTSGWGKFKLKCSQINKKMADGLKPVSEKCKKKSQEIGEKFDTTNNSFIKGIRDWSMKTQNALNQGYKQGEECGDKRRNSQIPNQVYSAQ